LKSAKEFEILALANQLAAGNQSSPLDRLATESLVDVGLLARQVDDCVICRSCGREFPAFAYATELIRLDELSAGNSASASGPTCP